MPVLVALSARESSDLSPGWQVLMLEHRLVYQLLPGDMGDWSRQSMGAVAFLVPGEDGSSLCAKLEA